jgi:hypothetical protein
MKHNLIKPFVGLSKLFGWLAEQCGHQAPPPQLVQLRGNVIEMMELGRMGLLLKTEEAVNDALRDRERTPRDQGSDNDLLGPLSGAIKESIRQGDFRLAAEIFRETASQRGTFNDE